MKPSVPHPASVQPILSHLRYTLFPVRVAPTLPGDHAYQPKAMHLARIVSLIKALRGDVFGEFVTLGLVQGDFDSVTCLDCRLPAEALPGFAPVLRLDYAVTSDADEDASSMWNVRFQVHLGQGPPVKLRVIAARRATWRLSGNALDLDLVAVDGDNMYVRYHTPALRVLSDRLSYLVTRIRHRRFCLLDATPANLEHGRQMRRAAKLVNVGGWHMDDMLGGRATWVVALWGVLTRNPDCVRLAASLSAAQATSDSNACQHSDCPLCHEAFAPSDVVVNLSCNHNFHVNCPTSSGTQNGLSTWLDEHDTCPCCRAKV
jgi:hypothetical protein